MALMSMEAHLQHLLDLPSVRLRQGYLRRFRAPAQDRLLRSLLCHLEVHRCAGHEAATESLLDLLDDLCAVWQRSPEHLCHRYRASLQERRGDLEGCVESLTRAVRCLEKQRADTDTILGLQINLGVLAYQNSNPGLAEESFRKAANLGRRAQRPMYRAAALYNLAWTAFDQDNLGLFDRFTRRTRTLARGHVLHFVEARLALLLAHEAEVDSCSDQAPSYYKQAFLAYESVQDSTQAQGFVSHLLSLYARFGACSQDRPTYRRSTTKRLQQQVRASQARFCYHRGLACWQAGLPEMARIWLHSALGQPEVLDPQALTTVLRLLRRCELACGTPAGNQSDFLAGLWEPHPGHGLGVPETSRLPRGVKKPTRLGLETHAGRGHDGLALPAYSSDLPVEQAFLAPRELSSLCSQSGLAPLPRATAAAEKTPPSHQDSPGHDGAGFIRFPYLPEATLG